MHNLLFHLPNWQIDSIITSVNLPMSLRIEGYHILRVVIAAVYSPIEMMNLKIQIATIRDEQEFFPTNLGDTVSERKRVVSDGLRSRTTDNVFNLDRAVLYLVGEWVPAQTVSWIVDMGAKFYIRFEAHSSKTLEEIRSENIYLTYSEFYSDTSSTRFRK